MNKPKYIVATKGQYFAIKGGFRAFKRFNDLLTINNSNSLIEFLDDLKKNNIHYTIITRRITYGIK